MKKIYHLATCNTNVRILKGWKTDGVELHEIKANPIPEAELDEMIELAGGVEPLFSKRARKYRELGLHERNVSPEEMRQLLLEEYTFLKRPVLVLNEQIFIGNSAKVVAAAAEALNH